MEECRPLDDGVITRSLAHLFQAINGKGVGGAGADGVTHTLRASYLEIYNEAIYDLLTAGGSTRPPLAST